MKPITKEAEDLILDSIKDVCSYVSEGDTPTAAVIKVAKDNNLTPNFIELVCTGYNAGATAYQREKSSNVLEHMAEFPIANSDEAVKEVFSKDAETNTDISADYNKKPQLLKRANKTIKSASYKAPTTYIKKLLLPESRMKHAYCSALDLKRALDNKRLEYVYSQESLLSKLGGIADHIKNNKINDISDLAITAKTEFGKAGEMVISYIQQRVKNVKVNEKSAALVVSSSNSALGKQLAEVVKAAELVKVKEKEYREFEAETRDKIANTLLPYDAVQDNNVETAYETKNILDTKGNTEVKQANGFLGGILGGAIARIAGTVGSATNPLDKSPAQMSNKLVDALNDPEHENELRKIQARTMLQDFISNDEVISGYDPGDIMSAYNEIVKLSPRAATQPGIIRPLLRKRLTQGAIEPFEAAEMVNIEKNLSMTRNLKNDSSNLAKLSEERKPNVLRKNSII